MPNCRHRKSQNSNSLISALTNSIVNSRQSPVIQNIITASANLENSPTIAADSEMAAIEGWQHLSGNPGIISPNGTIKVPTSGLYQIQLSLPYTYQTSDEISDEQSEMIFERSQVNEGNIPKFLIQKGNRRKNFFAKCAST